MGLILKASLCVVAVLIAAKLYEFANLFGYGRVVYYHAPGPCRVVSGIENGSEDIQALPNGLAFISSGMRFPGADLSSKHFEGVKGHIYLFDFNQSDKEPVMLKLEGDKIDADTFNPHGVSLWRSNRGEVFLYVINHLPAEEAVDKFLFEEKTRTLRHVDRISGKNHENMRLLNDLVVIDDNQFYYTNYLHKPWRVVEKLAQLHWGSIGFFDGTKATIVADGLLMPNGVNKSPDNKYLYLSHIGERELRIYSIESDKKLKFKEATYVSTFMDNFDVDPETGDIWTGCHPVGHKIEEHMHDPVNHIAPSQVLRIEVKDGSFQSMTEVYSEEGHSVSGSTVAVYHKGAMLVGTVNHRMLYCQVLHK